METVQNTTDELLTRYADGPRRLREALEGLAEEELDQAESGGWSIRQIIHHLADGDEIWKVFIKCALGNPAGVFPLDWYWQIPQTEWAESWAYARRATGPSLALFSASRAQQVELLRLAPGSLEKCLALKLPDGSERPVSVGEIVEMQIRHLDGHIEDILRIRKSVFTAHLPS